MFDIEFEPTPMSPDLSMNGVSLIKGPNIGKRPSFAKILISC